MRLLTVLALALSCASLDAFRLGPSSRALTGRRSVIVRTESDPLDDDALFSDSFEEADQLYSDARAPRDSGADHDYVCEDEAAAAAASVDLAVVNELLAERVAAKRGRDFQTADDIRDELRAVHGVKVFDKERTWAIGGRGGSGGRSPNIGTNGHDYRCTDEAAAAEGGVDVAAVDALLAERLQAKVQTEANILSFELTVLFRAPRACRNPREPSLFWIGNRRARGRCSVEHPTDGGLENATPSGGGRGQRQRTVVCLRHALSRHARSRPTPRGITRPRGMNPRGGGVGLAPSTSSTATSRQPTRSATTWARTTA